MVLTESPDNSSGNSCFSSFAVMAGFFVTLLLIALATYSPVFLGLPEPAFLTRSTSSGTSPNRSIVYWTVLMVIPRCSEMALVLFFSLNTIIFLVFSVNVNFLQPMMLKQHGFWQKMTFTALLGFQHMTAREKRWWNSPNSLGGLLQQHVGVPKSEKISDLIYLQ